MNRRDHWTQKMGIENMWLYLAAIKNERVEPNYAW